MSRRSIIIAAAVIAMLAGLSFVPRVVPVQPAKSPLPTAINPNFLDQVDECFIPVASIYGYTLRITSGFRTMTEQAQIYDDGRDGSGTIISEAPPGHSLHNYGYAVDVVDRSKGYDIDWTELIAIGAYCHLENGGPGDLPHFEYRGGLTTDDFAAGKRPPLLTLPCPVMAVRASSGEALTMQDLQQLRRTDVLNYVR